jgi:GAF domain-containing protein
MFELKTREAADKTSLYAGLREDLQALLHGESDLIANAANLSALLFHTLPDVNWAGVYLLKDGELVLGPFQGKPACVRIALGRGVCGTAAARRESVIVPDVEAFPGHIACDSASRSELVVPIIRAQGADQGALIGVLDLDSPTPGRFDTVDRDGCEALIAVFVNALEPAATAQR